MEIEQKEMVGDTLLNMQRTGTSNVSLTLIVSNKEEGMSLLVTRE